MFQKFPTFCWLYSPRHWALFSATFPPAPTSPGMSSPVAAWPCTGSPSSPQSLPYWTGPPGALWAVSWEPDHLWPAQRPVLAHGGFFQCPYTGARALSSASTGPAGCFSFDSVLCYGWGLGNSIGKHGQEWPTAHKAMRRALWAWHRSSNFHIFRPQKAPNFLHISHFSTRTMCFSQTGRVLQLVL